MSRMLTLASAITAEMPAIMPTRSEPMMVTIARPDSGPAPALLVGCLPTFCSADQFGRTIGDLGGRRKTAGCIAALLAQQHVRKPGRDLRDDAQQQHRERHQDHER